MTPLSPTTIPEARGLNEICEDWRIVAYQDAEQVWGYVGGITRRDLDGLSTVKGRNGDGCVLYARLIPEPKPKVFRNGRMR